MIGLRAAHSENRSNSLLWENKAAINAPGLPQYHRVWCQTLIPVFNFKSGLTATEEEEVEDPKRSLDPYVKKNW